MPLILNWFSPSSTADCIWAEVTGVSDWCLPPCACEWRGVCRGEGMVRVEGVGCGGGEGVVRGEGV